MRRDAIVRVAIYTGLFLALDVIVGLLLISALKVGLPDLAALEAIRPKLTSVVASTDGERLKTFAIQQRTLVPYEELPPVLVNALVASEDRHFWDHWGVDVVGIFRATVVSLLSFETPRATSTITQQLARDLFLTKERSLVRKAKEAILAVRIERTYTKREILQLYLNQVFFGQSAYGVQAAARAYFDKSVKDLAPEEAATLVGMLPAPNSYHPIRYPDRAKRRRNIVLWAMGQTGTLDDETVDSLRALPMVTTAGAEELGIAPYYTEYIRLQLNARLADSPELHALWAQALGFDEPVTADKMIYEGGLIIESTLDSRLQRIAERVVDQQVDSLQAFFDRAVRRSPNGARIWVDQELSAEMDSVVAKPIQVALVALDVRTGAIRAMVGGSDFDVTRFNRAVQALRQPGSAFKPFVWAAAIDNGYTGASEIPNQPVTLHDGSGKEWRPENYDGSIGGPTTLRRALRHSLNLVAARLILQIGPGLAVQYARNMGVESPLPSYPSLALGSGEVRLIELTSAYGVFPNGGIHVAPFAIGRVTTRDGVELLPKRNTGEQRQALSPQTAFLMTKLLEDVVIYGTGNWARSRYGFLRPAAGKTGTTDDYGDAWFVGFTPDLVCGVWVGFDQRANMGRQNTGNGAALPIWARFMKEAHAALGLPATDFAMPEGVVAVQLCDETREAATPYCPAVYTEYFRTGEEPPTCHIHRVGSPATHPEPAIPEESTIRRRF